MGLLKHFEEYRESRVGLAMTVPGFIGFVVAKSPKDFHKYLTRDLKKQDEFKAIEMIIHGYTTDKSVDGALKADLYLKNYHGWLDKQEVKTESRVVTQIELLDV